MRKLKGKIAIVGNGAGELGKKKGEEIDGHDYIFRFNNFSTDGYETDYGEKITHWVTTFWHDIPLRRGLDAKVVCPLPLNDDRFVRGYHLQKYHGGHNLHAVVSRGANCMPFELYEELLTFAPWPSAGLMMIWWLYRSDRIPDVKLYGFDFFQNKRRCHYFDKSRNVTHHGELEKLLVAGMFKLCVS